MSQSSGLFQCLRLCELCISCLRLGGPGTGKGTQSKIVASVPGFHHSATGDVFRSLDRHSELGKIFSEYSSRGELVPDDVTVRMWAQNIHARTVRQAAGLLGRVLTRIVDFVAVVVAQTDAAWRQPAAHGQALVLWDVDTRTVRQATRLLGRGG